MQFFKKKTLYRNQGKTKYLTRITLFACRLFSVKLHKAYVSDPAHLHDHPWSYISIILWGGYTEHTLDHSVRYLTDDIPFYKHYYKAKWYKPGSILFRKADQPHRLEIPDKKYCITLIFTSYKWRDWGFMTLAGWKSHKVTGVDY